MEHYSIYIHIPFCISRCTYCDFNTYAGFGKMIPKYVDALIKEINYLKSSLDEKITVYTVFFGGGTPSLLSAKQVYRILSAIDGKFNLLSDAEISLEANPGTVSFNKIKGYREAGINRISFGAQSIHSDELNILGRIHKYDDVINAWKWSRKSGIDNINLDILFGIPNQNIGRWKSTLTLILKLQPEHLSLYSLIIEPSTKIYDWNRKGILSFPNEDVVADMYEFAQEYLDENGYSQYEISNWSKKVSNGKSYECIHNKQYWKNKPYIGLGAGAHGFVKGYRLENVKLPRDYINRMSTTKDYEFPVTPATQNLIKIDRSTEMRETMFMGLRLTKEGVENNYFRHRFGEKIEKVFKDEIEELIQEGLLVWSGEQERIRLTRRGMLLGNQVFIKFV